MQGVIQSVYDNFLGNSSNNYKLTIIAFLVLNPILLLMVGPYVLGWLLVLQFIYTLAMALKCYPLLPGGLLAIQGVLLGLTSAETVYYEAVTNFKVILLLMFMVAGIYFMRGLLLFTFSKVLLGVRSKVLLSFLFSFLGAVLSAFLDALTVAAVLISVMVGFYTVYHKVASGRPLADDHDHTKDHDIRAHHKEDLKQFRAFLRGLMMHGAVGTALGGVCTTVGEPQNLLIADKAGWEFIEFFVRMAPITMPTLVAGLATCILLELTGIFGYGAKLPERVREVLENYQKEHDDKRTLEEKVSLGVQVIIALILVLSLAFQVAQVGIIGLMIIVLLTTFTGVTEEHQIGHAFEEALPFTALLVVFFAIVAVIHDQHLFSPVTHWVLSQDLNAQPLMLFAANGLLSAISDNVFVATVYIGEIQAAHEAGDITREHFDVLAIAINTGTNLPSVATPNGQAAFLFLLTSALAPLIRLSYVRMLFMAIPYTIVLTTVGAIAIAYNF